MRRPSTRLAFTPDLDVFAPWQLCWLNGAPISLFVNFPWEIQIPDCDLNVPHFQQPEANWHNVVFTSFLESACLGQRFCYSASRACCGLCGYMRAGLQALGFHLKAVSSCVFFPFVRSCFKKQGWAEQDGVSGVPCRCRSTHIRSLSLSQTTVV